MRDLKPLSSDTYESSNTVYARNDAFQPIKITKHSSTATSIDRIGLGTGSGVSVVAAATAEENIEYEYVWDASAADSAVVGHTENRPDLVRVERSPSGGTTGHSNGLDMTPPHQQHHHPHHHPVGIIGSSSTAPRCRCIQKTPTGSPERRLPPKSATLNRMENRTPSIGCVSGQGVTSGSEFSPPPLPIKMRDVFGTSGQQQSAVALMGSPTDSLLGTTVGTGLTSTSRRVGYGCGQPSIGSPTDPFATIGGGSSPVTNTGSLPRRGGGHSSASGSPLHHAAVTGSQPTAVAATSSAALAHSSSVTLPRRQTQQAPKQL